MSRQPLLSLRALRRIYPEGDRERVVLDGVDLAVEAGECVALLGRSGSGKSTLLNLISGIDRPTGGSVHIAGTDLTHANEQARTLFRRRYVGFVYQFFNLIPTLTVSENLRLPLELNGWAQDASDQRIRHMLEAVGLADRAGAFPDRLSGGEQQRVGLARALVHQPELVLADEPTGNLDAETGARVIQLLGDLVRGEGKTLMLVTHDPQVTRLADRTLRLTEGRLIAVPETPP